MNPYLIFFLSWLVPGLGHLLQKRRLKAAVFFLSIVILLALGILMKGKFYNTAVMHPLLLLGFAADLGNGLLYFLVRLLGLSSGTIAAPTFHYGTAYMATAGLLNYLVALNAFDVAKGRKE